MATVGLTALLILRAYKPEWAPFLRMAVTVVALGLTVALASTVLTYITDLASATGALEGEEWSLLLKALGVAFLTETAASVCRDSGETGLATWVETAGKLEILLLSFPLIRTVMDTVTELLGMA
ncbi:MAG: stage III sporulation AC/AD family protein [Clostridia bacterium]|nr:stage III sporulation AC/AD family protein [Clostridia bacterium]